jgi:hypothetical protein
MKVKELMRPINEFSGISNQATFLEAVVALEKADEKFQSGKASQRILLVHNAAGKVIGKMSPMDVVQGLEPKYLDIDISESTAFYQLTRMSLESINKQIQLWHKPLEELCKKAHDIKIHEFIKRPTSDHMVKTDDMMGKVFHLFVIGRHDSLFVQDEQDIVGLIRFSDVYRKIRETIKACPF